MYGASGKASICPKQHLYLFIVWESYKQYRRRKIQELTESLLENILKRCLKRKSYTVYTFKSIIQLQRTTTQDGFIKNKLLNGQYRLQNPITRLIKANLKMERLEYQTKEESLN